MAGKRHESDVMRCDFKYSVAPVYSSFTRMGGGRDCRMFVNIKIFSVSDLRPGGGGGDRRVGEMIGCHYKKESNYQFKSTCKNIDNSNQGQSSGFHNIRFMAVLILEDAF